MTQTTITLKQIKDSSHTTPREELDELEEGQQYQGFVVTNVEEQECQHPERRWEVDEQRASDAPPMTGTCRLCGQEKQVVPDHN